MPITIAISIPRCYHGLWLVAVTYTNITLTFQVDFFQMPVNTLRRYKKHYKLQTRPGLNKAQLADVSICIIDIMRIFIKPQGKSLTQIICDYLCGRLGCKSSACIQVRSNTKWMSIKIFSFYSWKQGCPWWNFHESNKWVYLLAHVLVISFPFIHIDKKIYL